MMLSIAAMARRATTYHHPFSAAFHQLQDRKPGTHHLHIALTRLIPGRLTPPSKVQAPVFFNTGRQRENLHGGGLFFDVSRTQPEGVSPSVHIAMRVYAALVCVSQHGALAALSADGEDLAYAGRRRTRALMAGPIWPTPMPPICTQNMTVMTRPPLMGHLVVSGVMPSSPKHSLPSNCSASRCLRGCRRNETSGVQFSYTHVSSGGRGLALGRNSCCLRRDWLRCEIRVLLPQRHLTRRDMAKGLPSPISTW